MIPIHIEPLETRIAPATLVNPTTVTYIDYDGDLITVKTSLGTFALANPNGGGSDNFTFSAPTLNGGQQLQIIDLHNGGFDGANLTITVTKKPGGDGLAHIGYINSADHNLGAVKIPGDLGAIDVGSGSNTPPSVQSLTVHSMGLFGTATGAADLESRIFGSLGALTVSTDVKDVFLHVRDGIAEAAKIGSVKIGGSLIGGLANFSGSIFGLAGIGEVTIGGNVVGGTGVKSGRIYVENSSPADAEIGNVAIGGSLIGGAGSGSGSIFNNNGGIGTVKIGGNLQGGIGAESGKIDVQESLVSLTVGGSILGGLGAQNTYTDGGMVAHVGQVFARGQLGDVTIAHDLHGDAGAFTGSIKGQFEVKNVTIGGSMLSGLTGANSGTISSGAKMGLVKIAHDVRGTTIGGGRISALGGAGEIAGVAIGGSLIGGAQSGSGSIEADSLGTIGIGHDVLGGAGANSGLISTPTGGIVSVTIGGSLIGGSGTRSGGIDSKANFGAVKIGRDLIGGSIAAGAATLTSSGFIRADGRIVSVEIGGSIFSGIDNSSAGSLTNNASIRATYEIGSLTVKGDISGNHTGVDFSPVIISARGQASGLIATVGDLAMPKIVVGHRVEDTLFLAGFNTALTPVDADARVGTVTVGGDWVASSIAAGAINLGSDNAAGGTGANADNISFGNSHDVKMSGGGVTDDAMLNSKIGSVIIKGQMIGAVSSEGRHFGLVAEEIGLLKIGTHDFTKNGANEPALTPGAGNDYFDIAGPKLTSLREFGAGLTSQTASSPALLVNASTVTYTDRDGDFVTVKLSKPLLTDANVNNVFKFDSALTVGPSGNAHAQLQLIDLTQLDPTAAGGINVSVTAKRGLGDGLADVGYINAAGLSLGAIVVSGDLGSVDATSGKSVKVRTLGRLGLESSGAFTADLQSHFGSLSGAIFGTLTVAADLKDAEFVVQSIGGSQVGSVKVGGSIVGGRVIGSILHGVKIGGNVTDGQVSAQTLGGFISSATIGGSLIGGADNFSGAVIGFELGSVTIAGNVVGGLGTETGRIASGPLGAVKIGGSLIGGSGQRSGTINAGTDGNSVTITHNVLGGAADTSGSIGGGTFKQMTIGGSLIGGGEEAGKIEVSGALGAVKIGHDAIGGTGHNSGTVRGQRVASYTLGGSLAGGSGDTAGSLVAVESLGPVKIGHDLAGGSLGLAGVIDVLGDFPLKSITLGGSLIGGSSGSTGGILSAGDVGPVKIGRDLLGGSITGTAAGFDRSGFIIASGRITGVTLGGSLVSGVDNSTGGALTANATIRAGEDLGALAVTGSLFGRTTANGSTPVIISADHATSADPLKAIAIGKISVGGLVNFASIDGGYTVALVPLGTHAQIGAVSVKGNWLVSNLLAGVLNAGADHTPGTGDDNLNFGNGDDRPLATGEVLSKIASITIGGVIAGTPGGTDHYGFVSHTIGAFKMAGYTAPLTAGPDFIGIVPQTGDFAIHEV